MDQPEKKQAELTNEITSNWEKIADYDRRLAANNAQIKTLMSANEECNAGKAQCSENIQRLLEEVMKLTSTISVSIPNTTVKDGIKSSKMLEPQAQLITEESFQSSNFIGEERMEVSRNCTVKTRKLDDDQDVVQTKRACINRSRDEHNDHWFSHNTFVLTQRLTGCPPLRPSTLQRQAEAWESQVRKAAEQQRREEKKIEDGERKKAKRQADQQKRKAKQAEECREKERRREEKRQEEEKKKEEKRQEDERRREEKRKEGQRRLEEKEMEKQRKMQEKERKREETLNQQELQRLANLPPFVVRADPTAMMTQHGAMPENLATWSLEEIQENALPKNALPMKKPVQQIKRAYPKAKLFDFLDNVRPAYYGTWRKKPRDGVSGRRPYGKMKDIDYEIDSDQEWHQEVEDAEECLSTEEFQEEDSETDEDLIGFRVPACHLSEGEGDSTCDSAIVRPKEWKEMREQRLLNRAKAWEESIQKKKMAIARNILGPSYEKAPLFCENLEIVVFD